MVPRSLALAHHAVVPTRPTARRRGIALVALVLLAGCAGTGPQKSVTALKPDVSGTEIVLMPLDVELSVLTAGGLTEPNAEWTAAAKQHMAASIRVLQAGRDIKLLNYDRPPDGELARTLDELERLHGAVGNAIILHKYVLPLPTKRDVFDWTLGPQVQKLRDYAHADYALFIFVRDSYSSAGRVFVQLAAAFLGVAVTGGQQIGFASLVDLETGNVVWFNLLARATGDLRTAEPAAKTVDALLSGLPQ